MKRDAHRRHRTLEWYGERASPGGELHNLAFNHERMGIMPTFALMTQFTKEDLQRFLASGSNLVVAKPSGGGTPNVAWIVFRPMVNNTMTWEDKYGIYASNSEIVNGARLDQMSKTEFPAMDGRIYALNPAGFFGPSSSGGISGTYSAVNNYNNLPKGYLTFGLFQNASINGAEATGNAVSAAPVIYNSQVDMTPFTTIYLWIQSQVTSNTVVTVVTSPMTEVTFGGNTRQASLAYNPNTGKFVPVAGQALPEGIILTHIEPMLETAMNAEDEHSDEGAPTSRDEPGTCYSGRKCTGKILHNDVTFSYCQRHDGKSWQGQDGTCYPC